jgi:hypothetical protein
MTGDMLRDSEPRLILSGLQIGTRGGTDWPSVELREPHALVCQPIDVWGLIERIAEATKVCPAEIISEDQYDIWPFCCNRPIRNDESAGD